MADDERSGSGDGPQDGGGDEEREERPYRSSAAPPTGRGIGGGFFSIYKPGQGYWTRLGTVLAVALLLALVSRFIYVQLDALTDLDWRVEGDRREKLFPTYKLSIVGVFAVGVGALVWHYLNKPSVVDFMIATESEMKKVNWTSRKELMGSTKVVIVFMLLIALVLFVFDLIFGWFFYLIRVLHQSPFG